MKNTKFWLGLFLFCFAMSKSAVAQPLPKPETGRIERLASFPSKFVDARHVDVWLPDNFDALKAAGQRFNVIYMHDGQMLFDSTSTWNKQAWHVDRTVSQLVQSNKIPPCIVVGIWNNGPFRHSEYFPQKFLLNMRTELREELIQSTLKGKPRSDAYLKFIVEELKNYIDKRYPTSPSATHTLIMGSSMGGLISVYAMSEYPDIFGAAAGISTHWVGISQPNSYIPQAAYEYLREHLPDPKNHRLYQDHGTVELDAMYGVYQGFVDQIARDKRYQEVGPGATFKTLVFEGTGHNEMAWARRLEVPLEFIFSP